MILSRILSICLICLTIAACDTHEQTANIIKMIGEKTGPVKHAAEIRPTPEKITRQNPTTIKTRPAINLSIDNMHIDHHIKDDNFLIIDNEITEKNSLLGTLSNNQIKPGIILSGKLITDEDKVENKEYLDSVDGVQINIEGSFN